MGKRLTTHQLRVIWQEFIPCGGNYVEAMKRVYPHYSRSDCHTRWMRHMKNPSFAKELNMLLDKIRNKIDVEAVVETMDTIMKTSEKDMTKLRAAKELGTIVGLYNHTQHTKAEVSVEDKDFAAKMERLRGSE